VEDDAVAEGFEFVDAAFSLSAAGAGVEDDGDRRGWGHWCWRVLERRRTVRAEGLSTPWARNCQIKGWARTAIADEDQPPALPQL
jgi:hypothetical protein